MRVSGVACCTVDELMRGVFKFFDVDVYRYLPAIYRLNKIGIAVTRQAIVLVESIRFDGCKINPNGTHDDTHPKKEKTVFQFHVFFPAKRDIDSAPKHHAVSSGYS